MAAAAAAPIKAKFIDQIVTHPNKEWCKPRGVGSASAFHGEDEGEAKGEEGLEEGATQKCVIQFHIKPNKVK